MGKNMYSNSKSIDDLIFTGCAIQDKTFQNNVLKETENPCPMYVRSNITLCESRLNLQNQLELFDILLNSLAVC